MSILLALSITMQAALVPIPLQLGVRMSPDTVTVGQRFIVTVRIRAPLGTTVQFPAGVDTTATSPTGVQLIGTPLFQNDPDNASVTRVAAYRMAAWDTGLQPLLLGNIVVRLNGQTGYVSLGTYRVFVRSVLPGDSALRIPKPPRDPLPIKAFSEIPWLILFLLVVAAGIGWWLWQVYQRRQRAALHPFAAAEAAFDWLDSQKLIESGEGGKYIAASVEIMRAYLTARIPGVRLSQTSSELIAAVGSLQPATQSFGALLWLADLAKFAAHRPSGEEVSLQRAAARQIVRAVETEQLKREAEVRQNAVRRAA